MRWGTTVPIRTETGWVTLLHPDEQIDRLGSVGREWAGSGPIRLLDADGQEVGDRKLICEYPDSDRYLVGAPNFHTIGRKGGELDYWDGEM